MIKSEKLWFYLVFRLNVADSLEYKQEIDQQITNASILVYLSTIGTSIVAVGVISILTYILAKSITDPLKRIVGFTKKLVSSSAEREVGILEELNNLKAGDGQVAELVQAHQALGRALITRGDGRVPAAYQRTQKKYFTVNELYRKDVPWARHIEELKKKKAVNF